MENNIYGKLQYKCGICGSVYESIEERMNCEMACIKKQKEAEKKAIAEKMRKEKEARKKELDAAIKHAAKLLEAWNKDYGFYHTIETNLDTADAFWLSKLNEFFR